MANRIVYKFKITLAGSDPIIWRRILVPEHYSFWDLHVAIQDSMGWFDYHLHAFRFGPKKARVKWEIGIPYDEGFGDIETLPSWEAAITDHFSKVGTECMYEYDFGDGWIHELLLEGIVLAEKGRRYPRCVAGERSCPPEDCGGIHGYARLLEIITDPNDEEYEDMIAWVGSKFNPGNFVPDKVKFDNPNKRWEHAFSDQLMD